MSEYVSRIQVAEATYDIKDKNARNSSQINEQIVNVINESVTPKIEELEEKIDKVSNGITSINKTIKPDADGNVQLNAEDVNAVHKSHVDLLGSINMAGHVKLSEGNIQIELKEGETIIPDADKDTAASLYDTQQMGIALNNKIDSISGGEGCIKSVNGQKITPGDPQGRVVITGEDVPFSKEDDTKLKDVIESLDNSRVIPNSSETPTEPLVNLQIGDTTYKIQGGGGGSNVEPNPEETTDILTSIGIDGINYKIEGQTVQVEELPAPTEELLNKIYQYVGEDTETLINGRFYKCVLKEEQYQWEEVKFATDGTLDYNDLENLPKINNTELKGDLSLSDLGIKDVSANNETSATTKLKNLKIDTNEYIVTDEVAIGNKESEVLPEIQLFIDESEDYGSGTGGSGESSMIHYQVEEHKIGTWIDGTPVYERLFPFILPASIPNASWYVAADYPDDMNVKYIVGLDMLGDSEYAHIACWELQIRQDTKKIQILQRRGGTLTTSRTVQLYLKIQYTKTTD